MKNHPGIHFVLSALFILLPFPLSAHHSTAEYDREKQMRVRAIVDEVWFNQPHVRYYAAQIDDQNNDILDSEGNRIIWDIHTSSPSSLIRRGWTPDTIKEGELLIFIGSLPRNGAPRMLLESVEREDGSEVGR